MQFAVESSPGEGGQLLKAKSGNSVYFQVAICKSMDRASALTAHSPVALPTELHAPVLHGLSTSRSPGGRRIQLDATAVRRSPWITLSHAL